MKKCILILSCVVAFLLAGTMVSNAQGVPLNCPGGFFVADSACVFMGGKPGDVNSPYTPGLYISMCREVLNGTHAMPLPCNQGDFCECPLKHEQLWICCVKPEQPL